MGNADRFKRAATQFVNRTAAQLHGVRAGGKVPVPTFAFDINAPLSIAASVSSVDASRRRCSNGLTNHNEHERGGRRDE